MIKNWLNTIFAPAEREVRPLSCPGDRIKDDRMLQMVDGRMELVTIGRKNLYAEIQSHKDSVDVHMILDQYAQTGDINLIQRVQAQYMDIADAPQTLAEAYEMVHNVKSAFDNMPLDVRKEYDHDASRFIADFGTDHFNSVMSKAFDKADAVAGYTVDNSDTASVVGVDKEVNTNA